MTLAALPDVVDLIVIGAGPAGMAAATDAARRGLSVIIADENVSPGGQIYRAVTKGPLRDSNVFGPDYGVGTGLVSALHASGATILQATTAWMIERNGEEDFSVGLADSAADVARVVRVRSVVIATGALERPFPIRGWTLPGVMTAGACQVLLKAGGLVPQGPIVIAGCGPLIYLLAAQLARADVPVAAVLDTTPRSNWRSAFARLPAFLASTYAAKGLGLLAEVRRSTRVASGVTMLAANGENALRDVSFTAGQRQERIEAKTLLLHQGVVPHVNLAMAAGCTHRWADERLAFEPVLDEWRESDVKGLFIAGDGGGIIGAAASEISGRLAALGVAARLGAIKPDALARAALPLRRQMSKALRGRGLLDALYRPADHHRRPADDVIACRCEEVTAGAIRSAAARGAQGPNQVKAFLRSGMGPCQGRLCGLTVAELIAEASRRPVADVGYFRIRNPVKPITLGALSALQPASGQEKSSTRRLF